MWHPHSIRNWRACLQVGEIWLQSFGRDEKGVVGNLSPRQKLLNPPFHQICPTRKILLHDNTKLHSSARTTGAFTHFRWTVLPYQPYSPESGPSDYNVFGLWKQASDKGLRNALLQGWQRRGSNLYWVGMRAAVQMRKKNVDKNGESVVRNNYAFSNVVVKLC